MIVFRSRQNPLQHQCRGCHGIKRESIISSDVMNAGFSNIVMALSIIFCLMGISRVLQNQIRKKERIHQRQKTFDSLPHFLLAVTIRVPKNRQKLICREKCCFSVNIRKTVVICQILVFIAFKGQSDLCISRFKEYLARQNTLFHAFFSDCFRSFGPMPLTCLTTAQVRPM